MTIEFFDAVEDKVIGSIVASGKTSYQFALDKLFPLTDRFDAQRKTQDKKFYKRLERDIIDGCVMPPLTIAFVDSNFNDLDLDKITSFINNNIESGYILDGIQRLNTIYRIKDQESFNKDLPIYINVIISPTEDKLLYRMITLNNGQKPMTPRHQIEILTKELFDFSDLEINIQTEKEKSKNTIKDSFSLSDISKSYLAFLTGEVNNENNKIIGEKMDQIIVGRIMDKQPDKSDFDFKSVLKLVEKLALNSRAKSWLKVSNNLIGFCVGLKASHDYVSNVDGDDFSDSVELFDKAFGAINPSKVNIGKYRRILSRTFIGNYEEYSAMDELELIERFSELTS